MDLVLPGMNGNFSSSARMTTRPGAGAAALQGSAEEEGATPDALHTNMSGVQFPQCGARDDGQFHRRSRAQIVDEQNDPPVGGRREIRDAPVDQLRGNAICRQQ